MPLSLEPWESQPKWTSIESSLGPEWCVLLIWARPPQGHQCLRTLGTNSKTSPWLEYRWWWCVQKVFITASSSHWLSLRLLSNREQRAGLQVGAEYSKYTEFPGCWCTSIGTHHPPSLHLVYVCLSFPKQVKFQSTANLFLQKGVWPWILKH